MILVGNQRGGAKDLALHLLKEENDKIEVHELRGFSSDNLMSALNEMYAVSRATNCKQFMFSLSLNPPKHETANIKDFEAAIDEAEEALGLSGQPRAIVFHEKEGRRHAHCVWSRIDTEQMKAVQLSYSKNKLQTVSRDLFMKHGWELPAGYINRENRDPRNFTLAEWQQAKRAGKDAREVKTDFQDAWTISDSKAAFGHALQERGYKLARGDRRGFVAVDHKGEVYPVSRWTSQKSKQIRDKLGDFKDLPSLAEARTQIASEMLGKMHDFQKDIEAKEKEQKAKDEEARKKLEAEQEAKQKALLAEQAKQKATDEKTRKARLRKGWKGLLDRLTGERKRMLQRNEQEAREKHIRDHNEFIAIANRRRIDEAALKARQDKNLERYKADKEEVKHDAQEYQDMKANPDDDKKKRFIEKRRSAQNQDRTRGPTISRE